jgi:hypothetical protein
VPLGHDLWQHDSPETEAIKARQRADQRAWHAFCAMERDINAVRAAMADPDLGPEWADQLHAIARRAGALAGEEV